MDIEKLISNTKADGITRRDFFRWVIKGILFAGSISIIDDLSCGKLILPVSQNSLFMLPLTDDEKTVYAICETILPGSNLDPTGAPGAIDVGTMNVVYDNFYPAAQYIPLAITLVNSLAKSLYGSKFYNLNLDQRTAILENVESETQVIELLYKFIKVPFYVGMISDLGTQYMGYPGPNLGYRDQDFSFYTKMSEEMTPDGNLP